MSSPVPANAAGLSGYWPLDAGVGSVAADRSPFGRTGTINGGTWTPGAAYPRIHGEFHATELASVTNLDARDRGITNLAGIEHLSNLLSLDLSNNQLDNADLVSLVPRRLTDGEQAGELVGLPHLQQLNLDGNTALTDISSLAALTELRSLKLEETGVNASANNTTSTLLSLPDLEFLTMPNRFLKAGQNLVFDEGDEVNLLLADPASTVPWQVYYPWNFFDEPFASGTGAVQFDTTDSGLATLRIGTVFPVLDIEDIQLYIRNVVPVIESVPELTGIREGQTISIGPNVGGNFEVLIDGSSVGQIVVTDPSSADLANLQARFTLIDRNGRATELRNTSLHLDGTNFGKCQTVRILTSAGQSHWKLG